MYRSDRQEALLSDLDKPISQDPGCQFDTPSGRWEHDLWCDTMWDDVGPDWECPSISHYKVQRKLLRLRARGLLKYFFLNPDLSACQGSMEEQDLLVTERFVQSVQCYLDATMRSDCFT